MHPIMVRAIAPAISGLFGVTGTYLTVYETYKVPYEDSKILTRENESLRSRIKDLSNEKGQLIVQINQINTDLNIANDKYNAFKIQYDILNETYTNLKYKYERCTNTEGEAKCIVGGGEKQKSLKTADKLVLGLTSSNLEIIVAHITHKGPIIRLSGCIPCKVASPSTIFEGNEKLHVASLNKPITIYATSEACEGDCLGASFTMLEKLVLTCLEFNVAEQKALFSYQKTSLPGKK